MLGFEQFSMILKYVFVLIIYLFVFSIIRMVYMDISTMSNCDEKNANSNSNISPLENNLNSTRQLNKSQAYLKIISNAGIFKGVNGNTIFLKKEYPIVIGRGKECDIVADDRYMSNMHTKIWYEADEWQVLDMGSKNGTLINGQIINDICLLDNNDRIKIGQLELVYRE